MKATTEMFFLKQMRIHNINIFEMECEGIK